MIEEYKILVKDLSTRVPYGVIVHNLLRDYNQKLFGIEYKHSTITVTGPEEGSFCVMSGTPIVFRKGAKYVLQWVPYLRPMESMTEAERKEYDILSRMDDEYSQPYDSFHLVEWLLERHFDHMGLIGMGFALPAPEGMYDNKNN